MPNGGVPMHMILHPQQAPDLVIYCRAGVMHLFSREEWEAKKAKGTPMATLAEPESAALAGFVKYWLGESRLSAATLNVGSRLSTISR